MNIDDIWQSYSERIAEIELFQRAAKSASGTELKALLQYAEQIEETPELKNITLSSHNMTFRDARSGQIYSYHHRTMSVEDRQREALFRKNKQYQWLLAEAYEEFEDYLFKVYAYCGLTDTNFWPLCDYGNIKLSERDSLDFKWYLEQANKKKGAPRSILESFRKSFSQLHHIEFKNPLGVNLAFAIVLIEKLRHVIVHNGGRTISKENFIESVAKEAGIFNNGNISEEHKQLVEQFFGVNEYENLVALLEIQVQPELPFETYHCRFGILVNFLMAYGHLLHEMVSTYVKPTKA